jgi:hypothetical protein
MKTAQISVMLVMLTIGCATNKLPASENPETQSELRPATPPPMTWAELCQKLYPDRDPKIVTAMGKRQLAVGMTEEEVSFIWGPPSAIAKSVNASGTSELWTYKELEGRWAHGHALLYLVKGILVSWQETKR